MQQLDVYFAESKIKNSLPHNPKKVKKQSHLLLPFLNAFREVDALNIKLFWDTMYAF